MSDFSLAFFTSLGSAVVITAIVTFISYYMRFRKREKSPTIEDKINALSENLKSSISVISDIESEIESRSKIVTKLQADVKRYENLKKLSKTQIEAIAQTIRGEIAGESKKSLWRTAIITFFVSLIFFLIGYFVRGI